MKRKMNGTRMKKPLRLTALLCCAALAFSAFSGAFYSALGPGENYIITELEGYSNYNRVAIATVYINGVKAPAAFDGGAAAPGVLRGIRVTGASSEYESFAVATCRSPDSSFEDTFAQGAHIDPVASGVAVNAFGGVSAADSDGVRVRVMTGTGSGSAALRGSVRVRAAMTPSKGQSVASLYSEYGRGFVFETEDYPVGEDGFAYIYWDGARRVDGVTSEPEEFREEYLPQVNALCFIVTPEEGVSLGTYYYIGSTGVFREYHADLWDADESAVYTGSREFNLRTMGGVSPRLTVDGEAVEPDSERVDAYGDRNTFCTLDTAVYGDGAHTLRMTVGTRVAFEQKAVFDNAAPYLVSSSIEDGAVVGPNASLELKVADAASGVETLNVKLDGVAVTLPKPLSAEEAGMHRISWKATDRAGFTAQGSFAFYLSASDAFGDFSVEREGDSAALDVDLLGAENKTVSFTGYTAALPVTAVGSDGVTEAPISAYSVTSATGGRYPSQTFDVDVSDYAGESFTVSFTGGANSGETLVLSVLDPASGEWLKLSEALVGAPSVTLSAQVATAAYADNGNVRFRVTLFTVDNGSDTFAWTTDTQYYIEKDWDTGHRDIQFYMEEQFDRIAADYLAGDIGYMVNTGDTVNTMNEEQEYAVAQQIYQRVYSAGVPNGILPGNHEVWKPDFRMWQKYFGEEFYRDCEWYGGGLNNNVNHYDLITLGGRDFIFMYIGWTDETAAATVKWANRVLSTYRTRTAVVCFHGYLTPEAEFLTQYVTAEDFWNAYLEDNDNVRLILCGHEPGVARRTRAAYDGRNVTELLHCYQMDPVLWYRWRDGGSGLFRYMTVGDGIITSRCFSASREKYEMSLGHNVDADGGYYYWDMDEENYTMPVEYVESPRVIKLLGFAAYDPSSAVSLGGAAATAEGCALSVEDAGEVKLWEASVGGETSGVFALEAASPLAEGDPDGDGEVSVADALLALRSALGLKTPPRRARIACDLDGDGAATVSDALLIMRRAAALE